MKIRFRYSKLICLLILLGNKVSFSQETNSNFSGIVKTESGEILHGATVTTIHEPTRNIYSTQSNSKGIFYFFNLKPGGPYTIIISFTGYNPLKKTNIFINYSSGNIYSSLEDNDFSEFFLKEKNIELVEVTVRNKKSTEQKFGIETSITNSKLNSLPSISRNLQDYVRLVPQAKVNGDGMMSLAGQNNKYNAFYIDGSNYNDMLGLALSGTSGGQTGSPPISIEAIEEIKVLQSPYNVQYSNFTGGSINAVTKSGSNQSKLSAWYFFRNEQMAGRSPLPVEISGTPGSFERQKLSRFFNQSSGVWASGPFVKNKMFYFLLAEKQNELQPQPYNFSQYRGTSTQQRIAALADTIRNKYGYEPGSFLETKNELKAFRLIIKLDWNPSQKNKLTLSYRYNFAERITPQTLNSNTVIRFSNNRFGIPTQTHSTSFEWRSFLKNAANNRLLLTYNSEVIDRRIVGQPFPLLNISDGTGNIILGSNGTGQINVFKSTEFTLIDAFKFITRKNVVTMGFEFNFSKIKDIALGNYFGQYQYRAINDFLSGAFAFRYLRQVSLADAPVNDNTKAGSFFNTGRTGFYINNEIQVNPLFRVTAGLRLDGNFLPSSYKADDFFNVIAKPEIEKYYNLEGALSGKPMNTHWQLSPRIGFVYKIPDEQITLRGGAGVFTGHIMNIWASEIYRVNTSTIDIAPQFYGLLFNPDPYNQPGLQALGINPEKASGALSLVANNFKYPTVFRTSFSADKKLIGGWNLTTEIMITKNIHEGKYSNVNLLPPSRKNPLPDTRNVFSINLNPELIPMPGGNPFTNIFLLTNNTDRKSFSFSVTEVVSKSISDKLQFHAAYTYGNSYALFEPTGTSNTNGGQWSTVETVNGKNFAGRTVSDFDLGHRLNTSITNKIVYAGNKTSSLISIFYNGQSGSPFSYVYLGSILNDNGRNTNYDLIYIPTSSDLTSMTFIPNTVNGISFSEQRQKDLLNKFIEKDIYLRKHRGQFAERNGARLPFTHIIDIRLKQNFNIKTKRKDIQLSVIYDIFNFTNMLNKKWGRSYFLTNDNFQLIRFLGYANTSTLTPQYQFSPITGDPWSVQTSTAPGSSARWISQLGIQIDLY